MAIRFRIIISLKKIKNSNLFKSYEIRKNVTNHENINKKLSTRIITVLLLEGFKYCIYFLKIIFINNFPIIFYMNDSTIVI